MLTFSAIVRDVFPRATEVTLGTGAFKVGYAGVLVRMPQTGASFMQRAENAGGKPELRQGRL